MKKVNRVVIIVAVLALVALVSAGSQAVAASNQTPCPTTDCI